MSTISKAIAAFFTSFIALLVALGAIEPALAELLDEQFATAIASLIAAVLSFIGVYAAPANRSVK